MRISQLAFAVFLFMSLVEVRAQETSEEAKYQKLVDGLVCQEGDITLGDKLAQIKVPEGMRYLSPKDTKTVLVDLWGNPPGGESLGMLVPVDFQKRGGDSWGVVITYKEEGYIKDSEADSINYNDLLKDMKAAVSEANEERVKQGYHSLDLVGWAASPRYDKEGHKMYWAKELKVGGAPENTLNYNIRVLGRQGVLNLNAISGISDLKMIEGETPNILSSVSFTSGNRYEDYKPGVDKVAAYGLAGLVLGGVAVKAGFFKVLLVGLLAAKKFVIIGVVAVVAGVKKFIFGRDRNAT